MCFTDRIVCNTLLADLIFSFSSPAAVYRFARVNRIAYIAARSYIQHTYNINQHLSRFFPDPLAFRSLQARTATLISGSCALQFFDRSFYPDSDLDIYVYRQHSSEVGKFLLGVGYEFKPGDFRETHQEDDFEAAITQSISELDSNEPYPTSEVATIISFVKNGRDGRVLKVQMIVAIKTPVGVIMGFHSTCVMNIISFENAYSLYPWTTFEERMSMINVSGSESHERAFEKYISRGWTMCEDLSFLDSTRVFRINSRWIDDRYTWIIPLDLQGITLPPPFKPQSLQRRRDPVSVTNWQLDVDPDLPCKVQYDVLEAKILAWSYVFADPIIVTFVRSKINKQNNEWVRRHRSADMSMYFDDDLFALCDELRKKNSRV